MKVPIKLYFVPYRKKQKLSIEVLTKVLINICGIMCKTIGEKLSFGIIKRICYPIGLSDGKKLKKLFFVGGNDIKAAAVMTMISANFNNIKYKVQKVLDNKYISYNFFCPYSEDIKKINPEFCNICEQYCQGLVHSVSKEFNVKIVKKIPNGYKHCEFTISKLNGKGVPVGKVREPFILKIIPKFIKRKVVENMFFKINFYLISKMSRILGTKTAIGILSRACYPIGVEYGRRILLKFKLKRNLSSVAKALLISFFFMKNKAKVVDKKEDSFKIRILKCPFREMALKEIRENPDEIKDVEKQCFCKICHEILKGIVDAISVKYEINQRKTLSGGNLCCEFEVCKSENEKHIQEKRNY